MSKKQKELDTVRDAFEAEKARGAEGVQNVIAVKLLVVVVVACLVMFLWNFASGLDIGTPVIILSASVAGLMAIVYRDDREARANSKGMLVGTGLVAVAFLVVFAVLRIM